MADCFHVKTPFSCMDPQTQEMVSFDKGDFVVKPHLIALIRDGEQAAHGHMVTLPDDHHAVLPHLPEDHPAVKDFMAAVAAGQQEPAPKRGRAEQ